jgi:hypothetical protein
MKRKKPAGPRVVRDSVSAQISDEELQRRIATFRARVGIRIAGPDDPIYRDGLRMTAIRIVEHGIPKENTQPSAESIGSKIGAAPPEKAE